MHTHKQGLYCHWEARISKKNWVRVFIWETQEDLERENDITEAVGYAVCGTVYIDKHGSLTRLPMKWGEIHLVKDKYGVATAAHEIQHLINFWVERKGWNIFVHDEKIAQTAELLTHTFWKGHFKNFS